MVTGYGQCECVGVGDGGAVTEGGCLWDQFSEKEDGHIPRLTPRSWAGPLSVRVSFISSERTVTVHRARCTSFLRTATPPPTPFLPQTL